MSNNNAGRISSVSCIIYWASAMSFVSSISFFERRNWSSERLTVFLGFKPRHSDSRAQRILILGFVSLAPENFVVWMIALPYFSTYLFSPLKNRIARSGGLFFIGKNAHPGVLGFLWGKKVEKDVTASDYRATLHNVEGITASISGCWAL